MLASGTRLGPYEVLHAVGAGGMGQVFAGKDTRLDRPVAIKILSPHLSSDPGLKVRFEREARVISGLSHSHICTLYDVGETVLAGDSAVSYLVMEFCDGENLADRLKRGPLPIDQVLRYGAQIAAALDRAHRAGIIHRDLKPANIMLTKSGAKLLDFGLARPVRILDTTESTAVADATEHKPLTEEGAIVGTFQYMSPEQLEGREADARSDVFAFGAVLYEMITGTRAWEGKTRASLIASILEREPRPISEIQSFVPAALERVVRACLKKDPEERWQSAHDLMREIEWIRDGVSSPSRSLPPTKRMATRWIPWAIASLAALVAIVAVAVAARRPLPRRLVTALAAPAGGKFIATGDSAGPVTLSPDGKWVTYVAFTEAGPNLWLQSLETGDATLLPGTGEAMFPFWSPDSRSVGFFAGGKVKVIEIDGSAPRVVANAPDSRGGTWSGDGQILFTPDTQKGIYRVPADGGDPVAVTSLRPPFTTNRWPMMLPDGRRFVYLAASHMDPTSRENSLFIASVDGKENHKLGPAVSSGIPYGDYILYAQANKLVARKLDGNTFTGDPIRIRDNVLSDPGTWRTIASVSDRGLLAYHQSGAAVGTTLLWMDRKGQVTSASPPRPLADVALSPDGRRLALVVGDPKGVLYVQDLERGVETRLSFVDRPARYAVWTRDGRSVIFVAGAASANSIYSKSVDGGATERELLKAQHPVRPTDVSPDGTLILFDDDGGQQGTAVRVLPVAGGAPRTVIDTPGNDYGGHLSPDGRWILYSIADGAGRSAYLAPFPSLAGRWQVSNENAYMAWWNPNGREILYVTGRNVVSVDVSFEGDTVHLATPKPLFPIWIDTNNGSISMTPDGQRFVAAGLQERGSGSATLLSNWDGVLK